MLLTHLFHYINQLISETEVNETDDSISQLPKDVADGTGTAAFSQQNDKSTGKLNFSKSNILTQYNTRERNLIRTYDISPTLSKELKTFFRNISSRIHTTDSLDYTKITSTLSRTTESISDNQNQLVKQIKIPKSCHSIRKGLQTSKKATERIRHGFIDDCVTVYLRKICPKASLVHSIIEKLNDDKRKMSYKHHNLTFVTEVSSSNKSSQYAINKGFQVMEPHIKLLKDRDFNYQAFNETETLDTRNISAWNRNCKIIETLKLLKLNSEISHLRITKTNKLDDIFEIENLLNNNKVLKASNLEKCNAGLIKMSCDKIEIEYVDTKVLNSLDTVNSSQYLYSKSERFLQTIPRTDINQCLPKTQNDKISQIELMSYKPITSLKDITNNYNQWLMTTFPIGLTSSANISKQPSIFKFSFYIVDDISTHRLLLQFYGIKPKLMSKLAFKNWCSINCQYNTVECYDELVTLTDTIVINENDHILISIANKYQCMAKISDRFIYENSKYFRAIQFVGSSKMNVLDCIKNLLKEMH